MISYFIRPRRWVQARVPAAYHGDHPEVRALIMVQRCVLFPNASNG
jgi:hypothetical protein